MNKAGARFALIGIALFMTSIMSSCTSGSQGDSAPTTGPSGGPGATPTLFGIRGQAPVDTVEIKMLGASPVKVQAVARGYLPDGCTKIADVSQKHEGNLFQVVLGTYKAPNIMCVQVQTAYIQPVDLDVAGLKAGTYTVDVDGVKQQFTLGAGVPTK